MILDRIEKLQALTVGVLVVIAVLMSAKLITSTISGNTISVTGSAYEIVKSDSGALSFNVNTKQATKQDAYKAMQNNIKAVEKYLADKKITKIEKKNINGYYNYKRDARGNYTDIPETYSMSQTISISSDNVELIKEIANDITGLINQGVDIKSCLFADFFCS